MTNLKGGKSQPLPVKPKAVTAVDLEAEFIKYCEDHDVPPSDGHRGIFYAGADTILTELSDKKAFTYTPAAADFLRDVKTLVDGWFIQSNLKGSEDAEPEKN